MFKGFLVLYGLAALARGAHADKMMVDPTHIHAVLVSADYKQREDIHTP